MIITLVTFAFFFGLLISRIGLPPMVGFLTAGFAYNLAGFDIPEGVHPITPVMLYDAKLAQLMSNKLLEEGVFVVGFFYPVVPKDKARIRVQISAAHTKEDLDFAINAFIKVGKELSII